MFSSLHVIAVLLAVVSGLPTNPGAVGVAPIFHALNHCHPSKIWAVLVAGSMGWDDYGIQASICHAYQIFRTHGVPDSQIIVMMYDDIAYNEKNPNQGVIINKPGGPNVYQNVPKDYTGDDVTPLNFLNVITGGRYQTHGNRSIEGIGSGKVLQSGPNDYVFINFVGSRGSESRMAFPNHFLYAFELNLAFTIMHRNNMYKQLLVYLDSTYSGTMFNNPHFSDLNILGVSSSQPYDTPYSYYTYYDDDLGVYTAFLFSVAWMEDIDSEEHHKNLTTETVLHQYNNVVERVNLATGATPGMFGTTSIANSRIVRFFGKDKKNTTQTFGNHATTEQFQDTVKDPDGHISTLERRILKSQNGKEKQIMRTKLDALLKERVAIDNLLNNIMTRLSSERKVVIEGERLPPTMAKFGCYRTLVDAFNEQCVNISRSPYVLQHLYKLANICAAGDISTADVLRAFTEECTSHATLLNN